MQQWKFLLIGITGDLAKRKILPGLAQFTELNKDKVTVELIGYSRSQPDLLEIEDILNKHSSNAKHNLANIMFVQGEYSDSTFIASLFQGLKKDERLVVYISTPPVVFLQLLQTFCPYNAYNLNIIIEKPFGQNFSEAKLILQKVDECRLKKNIHYCDHYLFKNASYLNVEVLQALQEVNDKKLTKIRVQALEEVDAKGRGGYYDANGAIKDMLPAHLYSLLNLALITFTSNDISTHPDITVDSVKLGQYESYQKDVGNTQSSIETYFRIECSNSISMILESGKSLGQKSTVITMDFDDGSVINWEIDPSKILTYSSKGKKLTFDIKKDRKLDHTNMFEDLLNGKSDRFFISKNVLPGWKMYEQILEFIKENNIVVEKYPDNPQPVSGFN